MMAWSGCWRSHGFGTVPQYARSVGINTSWNQGEISSHKSIVDEWWVQGISGLMSTSFSVLHLIWSRVYDATVRMIHIRMSVYVLYLAVQHCSLMLDCKILFNRLIFIMETTIIIHWHVGRARCCTLAFWRTWRLRGGNWINLSERWSATVQCSMAGRGNRPCAWCLRSVEGCWKGIGWWFPWEITWSNPSRKWRAT